MNGISKFTVNFTDEQNVRLNAMQRAFGASTRVELLRRLMALGEVYQEAMGMGRGLAIIDETGNVLERIRLL